MPYALDSNDMKFWTDPALSNEQWLLYAVDTLETLWAEGTEAPRLMSLGVHLRIIGRPGRIGVLERFLEHASKKPAVWIATRRAIAEHFASQVPPPAAA
jgi:hypothetical protein